MAISGLILTLSPDNRLRDEAMRCLRLDGRVSIGEQQQHRLPIVVDGATRNDDQEMWQRLHEIPGVLFVDVVCVQENSMAMLCDKEVADGTRDSGLSRSCEGET
jgi:nitrate reductase NapAB chaperone NapD